MIERNKAYIKKQLNKKRNFYRIKLGIAQLFNYPALLALFVPFIISAIFAYNNIGNVVDYLDLMPILIPLYEVIAKILIVIITVVCCFGIIELIAHITAQRDETDIQKAFTDKEMRYGAPILIKKKRDKKKKITERLFYSNIANEIWLTRRNSISDFLNISIIEMEYGKTGNIIKITSKKGRVIEPQDELYDDEF